MQKEKIKFMRKKSYLAAIQNAVGSKLFQSVFLQKQGEIIDVTKRGELSCANFVSWILFHYGFILEPHATIQGLEKDLLESGWVKITRPKVGAVTIWVHTMDHGKSPHRHIGFYIGNKNAVSHSTRYRIPKKHHWTFGVFHEKAKRAVEAIYWHPDLS